MFNFFSFLILFFTLTPFVHGVELKNESLSFVIHNSYDYPLAKLDNEGNITTGILKDIAYGIAQELNKKPQFVTVSRGRVDQYLTEGRSDLSCYSRKEWAKNPSDFFWSDELYQVENLIVYKSDSPKIKKLDELKKKRIGSLVNYKYPEMDQALGENGYIIESTISMSANFEKLLKNRIQYILTDSMYYYNLKDEILLNQKIDLHKFTISKFPVRCRLSKKSQLSLEVLNLAIGNLKKKKFFETTIKKYSPTFQSRKFYKKNNYLKLANL